MESWRWLAPEILDPETQLYDESADIFSFGIILFELVSQQVPYEQYEYLPEYRGDSKLLISGIINDNLRPTIPTECPDVIANLIRSCFAADPKLRPSSSTILKILKEMVGETLVAPVRTPADQQAENLRLRLPSARLPSFQRGTSRISIKIPCETLIAPEDDKFTCMCARASKNLLWLGYSSGKLECYSFKNHKLVLEHTLQFHSKRIGGLLRMGRWVCCWAEDRKISVWSRSGKLKNSFFPFGSESASSPSCMNTIFPRTETKKQQWLEQGAKASLWVGSSDGKISAYEVSVCSDS